MIPRVTASETGRAQVVNPGGAGSGGRGCGVGERGSAGVARGREVPWKGPAERVRGPWPAWGGSRVWSVAGESRCLRVQRQGGGILHQRLEYAWEADSGQVP